MSWWGNAVDDELEKQQKDKQKKKAADPVMDLKYFTDRNIAITLLISFVSGIVMMGMIFVPQFSENALKIPTGSGGYLVIILGVFAGVGAPISGKLIDKFGVKLILEAMHENALPFLNNGEPFDVPVISNWLSLLVIIAILSVTVVASLLHEKYAEPADPSGRE